MPVLEVTQDLGGELWQMLGAVAVTHAVGDPRDGEFFQQIEKAIGHKDLAGRRVLLLICSRPYLGSALAQLSGIAPGAGEVAAHGSDLAPSLIHLEHTRLQEIDAIEKVKILVEQAFPRQVDVVKGAITAASEWRDTLVGGVVDGEMD